MDCSSLPALYQALIWALTFVVRCNPMMFWQLLPKRKWLQLKLVLKKYELVKRGGKKSSKHCPSPPAKCSKNSQGDGGVRARYFLTELCQDHAPAKGVNMSHCTNQHSAVGLSDVSWMGLTASSHKSLNMNYESPVGCCPSLCKTLVPNTMETL